MTLTYLHYDVFTDEPLHGNQLAVFTDARGLEAAQMQTIANEMNFAETTFILPPEQPDTDVRMRIFTPRNEMPMAGHPTIGSTFALAEIGVIKRAAKRFVFGLNVGAIPVAVEWTNGALLFAWMTQPTPVFGPVVDDRAAVATVLGLEEADLAAGLPVQAVSCGVPFLVVPLRDRASVDRAVSAAAGSGRWTQACGLNLPIYLFAIGGPSSAETAYSRMFAPGFGILEDPATGAACGPLGCYLVKHGVVSREAAQRMVSLQGVAMGRPSRIHMSIDGSSQAIDSVQVGGTAVLVGRGELFV